VFLVKKAFVRSPFTARPNGYMLFSVLIVLHTFLLVLGGSIQIGACLVRTGPHKSSIPILFCILIRFRVLKPINTCL
jgi:hypothetical protein